MPLHVCVFLNKSFPYALRCTWKEREGYRKKGPSNIHKQLPKVFCIKVGLRNVTKYTEKQLSHSLFLDSEKETLAQVFSSDFCEISKNTFFTEHLRWLLANI